MCKLELHLHTFNFLNTPECPLPPRRPVEHTTSLSSVTYAGTSYTSARSTSSAGSRSITGCFLWKNPGGGPERADSSLRRESDRLHILQPNVDHIDQIPEVLAEYLPGGQVEIVWFYSPSFFPLLADLRCETVVYDCMDELSLFRGAPQELVQLEGRLLRRADVVFTGGRSLYEAKQARNPAVYCFPSSVDQEHFARGAWGTNGTGGYRLDRGTDSGVFRCDRRAYRPGSACWYGRIATPRSSLC